MNELDAISMKQVKRMGGLEKIVGIVVIGSMIGMVINPFFVGSRAERIRLEETVPFDGFPWYIEDLVTGGLISDYGSHYGVKADLTQNLLGKTTYYSALTTYTNGQIDRSYLRLTGEDKTYFEPADKRMVHFRYWGWTEEAVSGDLSAVSRTFFMDTDTLMVYTIYTNRGDEDVTVAPEIVIVGKMLEPKNENMMLGLVPTTTLSRIRSEDDLAIISNLNELNIQLKIPQIISLITNATTFRAFAPSFKIESVLSKNDIIHKYTHAIKGAATRIGPGENYSTYFIVGFDQSREGAVSRAKRGFSRIEDPEATSSSVNEGWNDFFESLPNPNTERQSLKDLYYMAHTALRMGLYAPRSAMKYCCSVPCKPHFNFFWCWDTPFHTLGQSEWGYLPWFNGDGPLIAEENMYTQFSGQGRNGIIYGLLDDSFTTLTFWQSQPPVHGWTISQIYERDGNTTRANQFIDKMYDASVEYIKFWDSRRDLDGDGLYEYISAMESGWDDTPRFTPIDVPGTNLAGNLPTFVEAVDLNSWLYIYMRSLANWAVELGKDEDATYWDERADDLARLIDEKMWSEEGGAWFDLDKKFFSDEGEFISVLTPAVWFPAFAGLSKNETRIRRVIEEHLLNPEEFFGEYPIPTVAYNSEHYNREADGYYWRGQIWLITAYTAIQALYQYGYEEEAEELADRLLTMMSDKGGIYETYSSENGEVGWGSGGVGDPSCFQFGWSSAFTTKILLHRYQRTRYVTEDTSFSGYVKNAYVFADGGVFYRVDSGEYEVPLVKVSSADGRSLLESEKIEVTIEDPYDNVDSEEVTITISGISFKAEIGHVYSISNGNVVDLTI